MRTFETGATRDSDETKPDYEGFLSPAVLESFGRYMTGHRKQADGKLRDSDNWQKGIPLPAYMKSMLRHVMDLWKLHRGLSAGAVSIEEACNAILFNVQGYLHEHLKDAAARKALQSAPKEFTDDEAIAAYKRQLAAKKLALGTGNETYEPPAYDFKARGVTSWACRRDASVCSDPACMETCQRPEKQACIEGLSYRASCLACRRVNGE